MPYLDPKDRRYAARRRYAASDKKRTSNRLWRRANPDKTKKYRERRAVRNCEVIKEYRQLLYLANQDKLLAAKRLDYASSSEKYKKRTRKYRASNKEKIKEYNQKRPILASEERRASALRSRHGMSLEQFLALNARQNGLCAICGNPPSPKKKYLSVDHNHALPKGHPKRNRGLLCHLCNSALGLFKDNPEILKKAIAYLTATC